MSVHTLRFYEKEGLLKALRDKNDRRLYTDEHIRWLQFVTKMKQSHMSLAQIKMYGELYQQGDVSIEGRRKLLTEHHQVIKAEMKMLQEIEKYIVTKIEHYDAKYNIKQS